MTSVAREPMSMRVMSEAAKCFGSSAMTFCQEMVARMEKVTASRRVVARAAQRAHARPFSRRKPQSAERPPKSEPEMRAVFAAAGFDR